MLPNSLKKRFSGGDLDFKKPQRMCTVRFLDDSEPLSLPYQRDTNAKELFDKICTHLDLLEKDYFGLRYVDSEKQRHWLDLSRSVYSQLKHVRAATVCFRVKFYPSDPARMLREEITRYFLFLQLRRDLHHGRLLCEATDACLLAAYVIQIELGDYDVEEHFADYVGKFKILPKQTQKQEEEIAEIHRTLVGQLPAESEANFLRKAMELETYGVDPHPVKDVSGASIYLGVTHLGVVTFQGNKQLRRTPWADISKLTLDGKIFMVHYVTGELRSGLLSSFRSRIPKFSVGYKCPTLAAAKHLWKCAVEQQCFFTLKSTDEVPRLKSTAGIFRRGSMFQFSGRCERECKEFNLERNGRIHFSRTSSNPQFVQRYSSLRSGSVPATFNSLGYSIDSLNSSTITNEQEGRTRSLDDFSRMSTPRRPLELSNVMIPEESSSTELILTPTLKDNPICPQSQSDHNDRNIQSFAVPLTQYDGLHSRRGTLTAESNNETATRSESATEVDCIDGHPSSTSVMSNGCIRNSASRSSLSSITVPYSTSMWVILLAAFIFTIFLLAFTALLSTIFLIDSDADFADA